MSDATTFTKEQVLDSKRKISLEIGDSKQSLFLPQFKSLHFDNEFNFSARLVDEAFDKAVVEEKQDGLIKWTRGGRSANFYTVDDGWEDGGQEFEVVFTEQPASNVVEFTIQPKGLSFHFQRPLTLDEISEGALPREDWVEGSYAVYCDKEGNYAGRHYRAGKIMHIPRPYIDDANGKRVWCDQEVDVESGLYRITIPLDFFNSAPLPWTLDPTFGFESIGGTATLNIENIQRASRFTAPEAGTITKLTIYTTNITSTKLTKAGVWAYVADNDAGALLATSDEITSATDAAWRDLNLSTPLVIVAATQYFMGAACAAGGGTNMFNFDVVSNLSVTDPITYPTFSDPFTEDGTQLNLKLSIYATYTAVGGGAWVLNSSVLDSRNSGVVQ